MIKIEVRTRNRIPRRIRAGVRFGPQWTEHEVSDKQLKAIKDDDFLETRRLETSQESEAAKKKVSKKKVAKKTSEPAAKSETDKAGGNG